MATRRRQTSLPGMEEPSDLIENLAPEAPAEAGGASGRPGPRDTPIGALLWPAK